MSKHQHIRILLTILALSCFLLAGCKEPVTPGYTVSGRVVGTDGRGIGAAIVAFSGDFGVSIADADGNWTKTGLKGSVIVAPAKAGLVFSPETITVSSETNSVNFQAIAPAEGTYAVSGRVTDDSGKGISGVVLAFDGNFGVAISDADGNWTKSGLKGSVLIAPTKSGLVFTPETLTVSAASTGLGFSVTNPLPGTYSASGRVADTDGRGIGAAIVAFSGDFGVSITDADGNWTKTGLKGSVIVAPAKAGLLFSPETITVSSEANSVNFQAIAPAAGTYAVSGRVTDASGKGIGGVVLAFDGNFGVAISDADGNWTKSGLKGSVLIAPTKSGLAFTPETRTVSAASTGLGFSATNPLPGTYSASGRVIGADGLGVGGVIVACDGRFGVAVTFADGSWTKSGLQGSVLMAPMKPGFVFSPETLTVTSESAGLQFRATGAQPGTYTVTGRVVGSDGRGVSGVVLAFSGNSGVAVSDTEGNWSQSGLQGSVIITPVKTGLTFSPANLTVTAAATGLAFQVQSVDVVSGRISDASGSPLSGVSVGFGLWYAPSQTGLDGTWRKDGLMGTVTVTPALSGWIFRPANRIVSAPGPGVDFTAYRPFTGVVGMAAGGYHSLVWRGDGTVWAWGENHYGQLGNGTLEDSSLPVKIAGLTGITAMAGGARHSVALKSDGTVWAWGSNASGQLGNGTKTDSVVPIRVAALSGVAKIAAGDDFTLALKNDGTVWAWGSSAATPAQVAGLTGISDIAAGSYRSLALKTDGTVWIWGSSGSGLTQVADLTGVTSVAAGPGYFLALKSDGTVWAWGDNSYGQLGDGTYTSRDNPTQVCGLSKVTAIEAGYCTCLAIGSDGTVWQWGEVKYHETLFPAAVPEAAGATCVAAGVSHCMALAPDGTIWVWGSGKALGQADGGYLQIGEVGVVLTSEVTRSMSSGRSPFKLFNLLWRP